MSEDIKVLSHFMSRPPVRVEEAISALGIDYRVIPMNPGESGRIERLSDGRYRITVNANESRVRQRFTAAHELGHYLLHRDLLVHGHMDRLFDPSPDTNPPAPFTRKQEYQANQTAANILMPRSRVERLYLDGVPVPQLAREFDVSVAAMKIRLQSLGLNPDGK